MLFWVAVDSPSAVLVQLNDGWGAGPFGAGGSGGDGDSEDIVAGDGNCVSGICEVSAGEVAWFVAEGVEVDGGPIAGPVGALLDHKGPCSGEDGACAGFSFGPLGFVNSASHNGNGYGGEDADDKQYNHQLNECEGPRRRPLLITCRGRYSRAGLSTFFHSCILCNLTG